MIANASPQLLLTMISFHLLAACLPLAMLILYWQPRRWLVVLGTFWGMLTGFIDLHSREPQLPALLLLFGGFFLAFMQPRRAWHWVLLIGLWVPLGAFLRVALGAGGPPSFMQAAGSFLALVPAAIGVCSGWWIGQAARRREPGAGGFDFISETK